MHHSVYVHIQDEQAEIIAKREGDGGFKVAQKGSPVQFKHPTKPGR